MQMGLSNIAVTNHHAELHPHLNLGPSAESTITPPKKLTINALHYSVAGTPVKSRQCFDDNFYTITFPTDFVRNKNQASFTNDVPDDPFFGYRDSDGKIDTPLDVTIQIPEGMSIGANTFMTHTNYTEHLKGLVFQNPMGFNHKGLEEWHTGISIYFSLYWSSDPCILLDLDSPYFNENTLQNMNITIENSGNTIGAGGAGGSGGHSNDGKNDPIVPGGGGGGGQGIHQTEFSSGVSLAGGDRENEYTEGNVVVDGKYRSWSSDGYVGPTFPGIGGASASFMPNMTGDGGAANGILGTLDAPGTGGQRGTGNANRDPNTNLVAGHGQWGGNVIYLRSNVEVSDATSTAAQVTGTKVNIINKAGGFAVGGGGGGAGGRIKEPEGGAEVAENGANGGVLGVRGEFTVSSQAIPGAAGAIMFWNTANVATAFSLTNEDSSADSMKGRDYTSGIASGTTTEVLTWP